MLGFDGGAIGADIYCDRSGILARTIGDCAKVLDALKDPDDGYYDPRDPLRRCRAPRCWHAVMQTCHGRGRAGRVAGLRIGVIRESMVVPPGDKADEPIVTAAARRDQNGARRQAWRDAGRNPSDPLWERDPEIEQMNARFPPGVGAAGPGVHARLVVPARRDGTAVFKEFAAAIRPTEFMPGQGRSGRATCADRLSGRTGRGPHGATRQSRHRDDPGAAAGDVVPLSHSAISGAAGCRLAGMRLCRRPGRFRGAQCALEILGRRRARRFQELGGGGRPAQPARRPPGRRRAHHAARIVAPAST